MKLKSALLAIVVLAGTVAAVQEGTVVKAGEIITAGLEKVRREVVLNALVFQQGEVITSKKISASLDRLRETDLFTSVFVEPIDTFGTSSGDTVTLPVLVVVEEKSMYNIQAGAGYGAFQGWYGRLELAYRNFFGLGHRGSVAGRISSEEIGGQLEYRYPYLFGLPLEGAARLYLERRSQQEYEGLFWGGTARLSGSFSENLFWRAYSRAELISDVLFTEPSTSSFPQSEAANTFLLGSGLQWDTRSGLFQISGVYSELRGEVAGPFLPKTNQFYKLRAAYAFFYPFWDKFTLMGAIQAAFGKSYGEKGELLPVQERYRIGFGGISPIRGYSENEVMPLDEQGETRGAGALLVLTPVEVRFPLFWRFQGAVFVDGGKAWRSPREVDLGELEWAAGPGILFVLPFGVIRVDYGVQLDEVSQGRFHISAGAF
ncbi:MAG: outer membrane protein assembly factor [Chitinispirillaceae bacterium]